MGDEAAFIAQHHIDEYEVLYRQMNPQGAPSVPAGEAANFLSKSGLPMPVLGSIWEISDYTKAGALDRKGAFMAFKLVAAAQQGHPVTADSVSLPGLSLPNLGSRPSTALSTQSAHSPQRPAPAPRGSVTDSIGLPSAGVPQQWAIQPMDQTKYDSIFESLAPENGKLPGAKVRPVLLNSGLSGPILARIWELSDQDKDGQLDRIEMSVALHLVYKSLQNEPIPTVLPPSLIHPSKAALSRRTSVASHQDIQPIAAHNRTSSLASLDGSIGSHTIMPNGSDPQRSFSVQPNHYARHGSVSGTPVRGLSTPTMEWPIDKTESAGVFAMCDTNHDGLVSGGDVKDELLKSGAPQNVLAHIWSLADTQRSGALNQEQFALVMHLLGMFRNGEQLPSVLPPTLVPPSMRHSGVQENGRASVDLSTSNSFGQKLSTASIVLPENPEIKQLTEEMERLVCEKREAEASVSQLEADMTVKNSEIRNLQIELATLENTVKALERQKAEAGKRLGDLDTQIEQLEEQCKVQGEKVQEATDRLSKLKTDTEQGAANSQQNNHYLNETRSELSSLEAEGRALSAELLQEQRSMELTVEQLTRLEGDAQRRDKVQSAIVAETQKVNDCVDKLGNIVKGEAELDELKHDQSLMHQFKTLEMFDQAPFVTQSTSSNVNGNGNRPATNGFSSAVFPSNANTNGHHQNAFAAFDAFPQSGHGAFSSDPFAGKDPFAATPSSDGNFAAAFPADPFAGSQNASSDPFSSTTTASSTPRPVPPRPAPPRPAPVGQGQGGGQTAGGGADPFAGNDPFSSAPAGGSGGGFADFSAFGSFS